MRTALALSLALPLALFAAQPATAQRTSRVIEVRAGAAWQHAETGMVVPSSVAGLARGPIADRTQEERDISAEYGDQEGEYTTFYLYQTPLPVTGIWMDRAVAAVQLRPGWEVVGGAPSITPFTRPGAAAATGLRTSFEVKAGALASTAIAIAPLGNWLVKIRMTSTSLDRAALDARLTRFIEGLRWPAETQPDPAAAVVEACPTALALKPAKIVQENQANSLMNALMNVAMADVGSRVKKPAPTAYCRDPGPLRPIGVYRPDGATDRYIIALGDAGVALSLAPEINLDDPGSDRPRKAKRFSMTLLQRNTTGALPSFNRLPPPDQAVQVAQSNAPRISASIKAPQKKTD